MPKKTNTNTTPTPAVAAVSNEVSQPKKIVRSQPKRTPKKATSDSNIEQTTIEQKVTPKEVTSKPATTNRRKVSTKKNEITEKKVVTEKKEFPSVQEVHSKPNENASLNSTAPIKKPNHRKQNIKSTLTPTVEIISKSEVVVAEKVNIPTQVKEQPQEQNTPSQKRPQHRNNRNNQHRQQKQYSSPTIAIDVSENQVETSQQKITSVDVTVQSLPKKEPLQQNENSQEQNIRDGRKPNHRNNRNNQRRQQKQHLLPNVSNNESVNPDEVTNQEAASVEVIPHTVESTQIGTEQIAPRKKNKKKKKSKAKAIETTVEIEVPVELPIQIETKAPKVQPQQKVPPAKQAKNQTPLPKEIKKVKPKLPLNDKSKRLFSYLTPLAKDFIKKVYTSLISVIPSIENESLIVCVSGGKDSVVLLDALWYISGMVPLKIVVAHCNHNLRGEESEKDEQFVRGLGKKYTVSTYCTSVNVSAYSKKYKQSIELAARNLRYRFFERLAKEQSISSILTAHTKDDTVETLLFNLVRGTGMRGITGIPRKRELDDKITVFRPILPISREEISAYAEERQLEWREDSSNTNLSFTRNKIRHKLLPLLKEEFNPSVLDTLYRFVEFAKGAESIVSKSVESYLPHIVSKKSNSSLSIHLESFKALSLFLKGELLLRSIQNHFEISLSLLHIEGVVQLIDKETGARYTVNEQLHVVKERNELIITNSHRFKETAQFIKKTGTYHFGEWTLVLEKVARQSVEFNPDPLVEYIDEDCLPSLLILRHWQHGDKFSPIGMHGLEQNVSDYLTNSKIPHLERERTAVLASTSRIFWVCGMRLSENCKVTEDTTNVLKATYILRSEKK